MEEKMSEKTSANLKAGPEQLIYASILENGP